jgi:ABC-2 type transport system permease protein
VSSDVAVEVGPTAGRRPSLLRIGLSRGRVELKQFFRAREAVIFTFAFPPLLLIIFGSVFNGEVAPGIGFRQVFLPGMIASGIMSVTFQSLAISVALERDDGTLKRLRGTPMPPAAYFVGKVVLVLVTGLCEVGLLLLIGTLFLGVHLPSSGGRWLIFGWVFVLGLVASALLGIAVSGIPRSGKSAAPVVTLPFVVLQFISGVYFLYRDLPPWLQHISAVFPLKWMCQGLRSVFLPDSWASQEVTGTWESGRTALVLVVWTAIALAATLRTFRWTAQKDK